MANDEATTRSRRRGQDLSGAVLNGITLTGADLSTTRLVNAELNFAELSGARFDGARMKGARLVAVKGKGVSFMEDAVAWHSKVPCEAERDRALAELAAAEVA